MTPRRTRDTATLRGGAVGALTAALAVAGHGIGGGGYPTSAALTLLVLCCGGVGALAGGLAVSPRGSRAALVSTLIAGQVVGHFALSTTLPHQHAEVGTRGLSMLASHAAATAVCAALILAAEKLYGPVTRALRVVLHAPSPVVTATAALPFTSAPDPHRRRVLDHILSRRGPPAAYA
ncbi:hypothetical protein GCM10023094_38440 [Rhodococcus olei]|uniref:MFS transporter n=1 Tax=Rhodococcus olei TaxID=2161675 RepID=A0ABP8PAJ9_9NOCA